jgi:abortive infection bacteriophage resistance protein
MKFTKPPTTYQEQVQILKARGMIVGDEACLLQRLETVGYYRLCAYWHPFKRLNDDTFMPNTRFETVWERYVFDRHLRLLVMDAIERVEVAVRTALVTELTMANGPFVHVDIKNFPSVKPDKHQAFLDDLRQEADRSKEAFVEHFRKNYDEFPDLPLWAAAETMTLGCMFTLFRMSQKRIHASVAKRFSLPGPVLLSWLRTLLYVRNLCAHHARLWNRELAVKPMLPYNDDRWSGMSNNRVFVVLTMLNQMLSEVAPQSRWRQRLFDLFDRLPDVPIKMMGIVSDNWRQDALWTLETLPASPNPPAVPQRLPGV